MELESIIGLEIHVQLRTKSKMFCSCDNMSDGAKPNTLVCPICTGHPGTLPVPNKQAIEWGVMAALALGCTVNEHSKFDRKHYFYPDLPKGYQISQFDEPVGVHGSFPISVNGTEKVIGITRLHLEEDVGKMTHVGSHSFIDFNRSGTPLMEIVTEPDFRSPDEAKEFLQQLRLTMRYLGVSNADMEKGELRCDANVSLRPAGDTTFHPKTEVKNINSFRNVERALAYEVKRQTTLWEQGMPPTGHETRGWDATLQETVAQRTKEGASDYRYFPEPDIPPMHFTEEFIAKVRAETPESPEQRIQRFTDPARHALDVKLARRLVEDSELARYFEQVVTETHEYVQNDLGTKAAEEAWSDNTLRATITGRIAKFIINRITLEDREQHGFPPAADLARLLWMVHEQKLTGPAANSIFTEMLTTKKGPHQLVKEHGLDATLDEASLTALVQASVDAHADVVEKYKRTNKESVLQFFVGDVMRQTKGAASAPEVLKILHEIIST